MRRLSPIGVALVLVACSSGEGQGGETCAILACPDGAGGSYMDCPEGGDLGKLASDVTGAPLVCDSSGCECSQLYDPDSNHCGADVMERLIGSPELGWVAWCVSECAQHRTKNATPGDECPPGCLPFEPGKHNLCCCKAVP